MNDSKLSTMLLSFTASRSLGIYAAAGILLVGGVSARANLIVNGDFETGNLTGWTVAVGGSATDSNGRATYGVAGFAAHSGNDGAWVGPLAGTVDLSQSINIPSSGQYNVSLWTSSAANDDYTVNILVDGTSVFNSSYPDQSPYFEINAAFATSAGSHTIDFQLTPSQNGPMYLDDINLAAVPVVPEPSTILTGLAVLMPFGVSGARLLRKKLS